MVRTVQCIECKRGNRMWEGNLAYTRAEGLESYRSHGSNKMTENTINHPMNQRKKQWKCAIGGRSWNGAIIY